MQQFQRIDKAEQKDPEFLVLECNEPINKNRLSKVCFGQWNDKEILKYFLFVHHHRQKFQSKSIRKSLKVFKQMAKFIKTRNSSQCRTHHQNLINKSKNIQTALGLFIGEYPNFFDKYEAIKETLNILDDVQFCLDTSTVVRQAKQVSITSEAESSSTESILRANKQGGNAQTILLDCEKSETQYSGARVQKLLEFQILFNMWASKLAYLTQLNQI